MTEATATTPIPPALLQSEAHVGARICARYRIRHGTLVIVRWNKDGKNWPELEVRWDDCPDYVARVVPYTISLITAQEA